MGGKGGSEVEVTRHYLSMFWGICAYGRGIELLEVKFGGKLAWRGNLKNNADEPIDRSDLFGGDRKEGGIRGVMSWLNGNPTQALPDWLAAKFGKTSATCPGYRGVSAIFLTGVPYPPNSDEVDSDGNPYGESDPPAWWTKVNSAFRRADRDTGRGFLVCANNPYIKAITARVRRPSQGLNPSIAMLDLPDSSEGIQMKASNAIHVIYEAMTNVEFGMGENPGMFDIGSWEQCAQVAYNEGLGVNILWTRQSKIEDFINTVISHVQGAVFVHPATGKHTIKLLRGDYTVGSLRTVSPSNAKLSNFKSKIWGDITNEVTVTWTNPESGKEETVTAQDPGAIAMQGGITSTSRNYHGFASRKVAMQAAERDLAAASYPLATCDAEVTKAFWDSVVNDCVILTWPRHGITSAVFRVTQVAKGSTSRTVKLTLLEDVFSLRRASYGEVSDTEWVKPSTAAQPLTNVSLGTAPAFLTVRALGLSDIEDLQYPEVISALIAAPDSADDSGYELIGYSANAAGQPEAVSLGERDLGGVFLLTADLPQAETSVISITSGAIGSLPIIGSFLLLGAGNDTSTEIVMVRGINGSNYTVSRGMLDTVPRAWPVGTRALVIPASSPTGDTTVRSAGEEVDYRLKTITSEGRLAIYNAPLQQVTLSDRPHRPLRPANVRVGGVAFGTFDAAASSSVDVTWSIRNRIVEATQTPRWNATSASPESGQTTTVTVLRSSNRAVLATFSGLTGSSATIDRSSFATETSVIFRVSSARGGMESLQAHEITVTLSAMTDRLILSGAEAENLLTVDGDYLLI